MKAGQNFLIIKTRSQTNDEIKSSIVDKEGKPMALDTSYNPYHHAKIKVEVHGIPLPGGNADVVWKYNGAVTQNTLESKKIRDFDIPLEEGDTVYVHYLGLDNGNYLDTLDDGHELYWVPLEHVFCILKDGKIKPVLGNVFVEPWYGEDVIDVNIDGHDSKVRESESGIITELVDTPIALQGTIRYIGENEGFKKCDLKVGDRVLYRKSNEFENEIEGEKLYVMKQWELFAKMNSNGPEAIVDYVMIKEDSEASISESGIELEHSLDKRMNIGTIEQVGPECTDLKVGDRVQFVKTYHYTHIKELDRSFLPEGDIIFKVN